MDQLASRRYVSRFAPAMVHLGLGEKDAALNWLEMAYEERDSEMPSLNTNPDLTALRDEPRFQALLRKIENGGVEK